MALDFSRQSTEKNIQIQNLMKIHPFEAEVLHADGPTVIKNLIVAFRNLSKDPKNGVILVSVP